MQTLKILSILLNYPEANMLVHLDDMAAIIRQEKLLPKAQQQAVLALIDSYRGKNLLELQEDYVALFDRGRFLSLHIFEHVHGESRDRGQAMVNLLQMYEAEGFELASQELPDYIPLFLEFLSQQTADKAIALLRDAMPVLSLLGARLRERNSDFQVIFTALASFAGETADIAAIQQQVATEGEDETLVNMDEIWQEEAVSFIGAGDNCKSQITEIKPIKITAREALLKR